MLFKTKDLRDPMQAKPETISPGKAAEGGIKTTATSKERDILIAHVGKGKLHHQIGTLQHGDVWHLVAARGWNNYDLVVYLAHQIGPADLWIATWAASDQGVKAIAAAKEAGLINRITVLMDNYAGNVQQADAAACLHNVSERMAVYPCHAKVYVLRNKRWAVSIVTSANLTMNPRLEAGVITEDRRIADFHVGWIEKALKYAPPFQPPPWKGGCKQAPKELSP